MRKLRTWAEIMTEQLVIYQFFFTLEKITNYLQLILVNKLK